MREGVCAAKNIAHERISEHIGRPVIPGHSGRIGAAGPGAAGNAPVSPNIYAGALVEMTATLIPDLQRIAGTRHQVAI